MKNARISKQVAANVAYALAKVQYREKVAQMEEVGRGIVDRLYEHVIGKETAILLATIPAVYINTGTSIDLAMLAAMWMSLCASP